eukprot:4113488-Pyramimonas_sp.AAC.1
MSSISPSSEANVKHITKLQRRCRELEVRIVRAYEQEQEIKAIMTRKIPVGMMTMMMMESPPARLPPL